MNAPDEEYRSPSPRRERICSHHHPYTCSLRPIDRHVQSCYICPLEAATTDRCPQCCFADRYNVSANATNPTPSSLDRYGYTSLTAVKSTPEPVERFSGYSAQTDRFAEERLLASEDLRSDRYIPPPAPIGAPERYLPPPDRFLSTTVDRLTASNPSPSVPSSSADRFLAPNPPQNDRYIPPPSPAPTSNDMYITPLSPSDSDRYSVQQSHPQVSSSLNHDRYITERYLATNSDRYISELFVPNDRYIGDRYASQSSASSENRYDRYCSLDRYTGDRERVLPSSTTSTSGPGDPYMRRDLGYHHHYRLPYVQGHYRNLACLNRSAQYMHSHTHTLHHFPSRTVRCQTQQYHDRDVSPVLSGSRTTGRASTARIPSLPLPPSSSSTSGAVPVGSVHSPAQPAAGSDYNGRYVTAVATPPLARCSSVTDVQIDKRMCLNPPTTAVDTVMIASFRRLSATPVSSNASSSSSSSPPHSQQNNSISWRSISSSSSASPTPPPGSASTSSTSISPPLLQESSLSSAGGALDQTSSSSNHNMQRSISVPMNQQPETRSSGSGPSGNLKGDEDPSECHSGRGRGQEQGSTPCSLPTESCSDSRPPTSLQHQASMPITSAEVAAASSRRYARTPSRTDAVKNYIKKETAVFFGVDEETEEIERLRWLDRRKRLAARKYGQLRSEYKPTGISGTQPDVLLAGRGTSDTDAVDTKSSSVTVRRKPSVAKMTFSGVAYVVSTLNRHRRKGSSSATDQTWLQNYQASPAPHSPSSALEDEVFFNKDSPVDSTHGSTEPIVSDTVDSASSLIKQHQQQLQRPPIFHHSPKIKERLPTPTWKKTGEDEDDQTGVDGVWGQVIDKALDTSEKRQYGMGVVGRFFGRSLKRSVINRHPVREQLDDLDDHRPFFTYWITTVQIIILFLSIFCYGLGPIGIDTAQRSGLVLVTSLSLQQVDYNEPANFWIGPRAADLIHMGAKFAPCMRKDSKILKEIEKWREKERETACCIHNDDSGCVQSSKSDCSNTISTWKKWSQKDSGPNGRISGSVCGLDPKYCEAPASIAPYEWPDDITKWPICRKTTQHHTHNHMDSAANKDKMTAEHMICEIIGHPCCIGIHGLCRITTREYCDFVHGYFHEEASLCSQVSCLDNVCGMMPFFFPEVPDQFYRLWTSLFLHAGVIHLAITLVIQYFLMRDVEKLTGSLRIGIIYIGSGVGGNLASAIFVPYRADVGPAGAQFGLLACLIVEVLNSWPMLRNPEQALMKLLAITFVLFLFGLLPWVDNFAHLFGFVFGFLLSYALLPFLSFGPYERQKKIFLIWVCLMSSLFLFILLILLFYFIPVYDCELCSYFNCLPLTRDFCASQNINLKRNDHLV